MDKVLSQILEAVFKSISEALEEQATGDLVGRDEAAALNNVAHVFSVIDADWIVKHALDPAAEKS